MTQGPLRVVIGWRNLRVVEKAQQAVLLVFQGFEQGSGLFISVFVGWRVCKAGSKFVFRIVNRIATFLGIVGLALFPTEIHGLDQSGFERCCKCASAGLLQIPTFPDDMSQAVLFVI